MANNLTYRETKKQHRLRYKKAAELQQQGYTLRQIANILKVSYKRAEQMVISHTIIQKREAEDDPFIRMIREIDPTNLSERIIHLLEDIGYTGDYQLLADTEAIVLLKNNNCGAKSIKLIAEALYKLKAINNIDNWIFSDTTYLPTYRLFQRLKKEWKENTKFSSSTTDICMHPSYQQIIGMGKKALRLILKELEDEPEYWFWALRSITGENPTLNFEGNMKKMARIWIDWGIERGYLK